MGNKKPVRVRVELRCKRDLAVSPEIHCEAVLLIPGEEEKILRSETVADENQLSCFIAELEDNLSAISGVKDCTLEVTGLERWDWQQETPRE